MSADFAWHIHHDVLLEPLLEPIEVRIAYIKKYKPKREQALRLRLLKPVRGKLPDAYDKASDAYVKAWDAHSKAWDAYVKAWDAYDKAREAYAKARDAHVKARDAYVKARDAYVKARDAYKEEIEALHAQECPDCPWDGHTIFAATGGTA